MFLKSFLQISFQFLLNSSNQTFALNFIYLFIIVIIIF